MAASLILPGTLEFNIALAEIPPVPTWRKEAERTNGETYLICRAGSMGLMEAVSRQEWLEYCNDGELDDRQDEIDAQDAILEGVIY
jgi:hypothetical protein